MLFLLLDAFVGRVYCLTANNDDLEENTVSSYLRIMDTEALTPELPHTSEVRNLVTSAASKKVQASWLIKAGLFVKKAGYGSRAAVGSITLLSALSHPARRGVTY